MNKYLQNFLSLFIILNCFLPYSTNAKSANAKIKILTTTTNLKSIVDSVGGEKVDVESICKGTQDPHYIEAKPSYTLKASKVDLVISMGLGLESGWLPLILRGARNPKLLPGNEGSFIAGDFIDSIKKPVETITRSDGDVHPEGNPHFLLDPKNAIIIASKLKDKLILIDPQNEKDYQKNFDLFSRTINEKLASWESRVIKGKKIITYHETLTYFYHRFGLQNVAILEPKPGVPPSARHILAVMNDAKKEGVKLVLVENYFDPTIANRVAKEVSGLKVNIVPVSVNGEPKILNLFDLYERLISVVEEN